MLPARTTLNAVNHYPQSERIQTFYALHALDVPVITLCFYQDRTAAGVIYSSIWIADRCSGSARSQSFDRAPYVAAFNRALKSAGLILPPITHAIQIPDTLQDIARELGYPTTFILSD